MRGATISSIRWAVFVVSALTALTGIALIVTGVYTLSDSTSVLGQRTLPVLLCIVGATVFLVSFLGIFGTATDSRRMLYGFLGGLVALIAVELIVGIVALTNSGAVDTLLENAWDDAWFHHPRVVRDVQEANACCGFRFVTDRAVPKSAPDACLKSLEFGYQVSCYQALVHGYRRVQTAIGVATIVLAGLQMVAVFLTYSLTQHIPKSHDDRHFTAYQQLHTPYGYYRPESAIRHSTQDPLLNGGATGAGGGGGQSEDAAGNAAYGGYGSVSGVRERAPAAGYYYVPQLPPGYAFMPASETRAGGPTQMPRPSAVPLDINAPIGSGGDE